MKRFLSIVAVLALTAVAANAAISVEFVYLGEKTTDGPPFGTVAGSWNVYDMMITTTDDWTNAAMNLTLTTGTLHQWELLAGLGVGTTMTDSASWALYPDLEWDTCVTSPGGWARPVGFAGVTELTTTRMKISWDDAITDTPGTYLIARISLSLDAQGTIEDLEEAKCRVYDIETQGVGVGFGHLSVVDGFIVPEPATLAMLAFGGLGVLIRKRR